MKPFTPEVRANIDNELVDKSIDFMRRQKAAGKSFFLYLPFSMGHAPNLPSKQFEGKSRIGNYGDKIMEGDYHVGQILDTLKELGIDNNTIVVFASDNGPSWRSGTRIWQPWNARQGQFWPVSRRAWRSDRGLDTDGGDHPLARQGQAEHNHLCHVLNHGFLADVRPHCWWQVADRPAN